MKSAGIYWLGLGAFLVGTSELIIAGILDQIAADFQITLAAAGQSVTVYSLVFAIGSPLLVLLTARMERKRLLLLSLGAFTAGCFLALISFSYSIFIVSRLVLAMSAGMYTVVSLHVGTMLVPEDKKGSAVGIILLGTSGSMVLGIPLGTLGGYYLGWRSIFLILALLSILAILALALRIPNSSLRGERSATLPVQGKSSLLNLRIISSLLVSLLWITGYSVLYTYITAFLQDKTGIGEQGISSYLFLFGLFGLLGTYAGGAAADRYGVFRSLAFTLICHALVLVLLFVSGPSYILTAVLLAGWAGSAWMSLPILQAYFASSDARYSGILLSLNSSVIHLGIAIGAAGGGLVIDHFTSGSLSWIGGTIVGAALLPLAYTIRLQQRTVVNVSQQKEVSSD